MKDKVEDYLVIIIYVVLVTALIFCALENIIDPWKSVYISLAIITSFTLKQLFIKLEYSNRAVYYLLILVDIIMTVYLSATTNGTSFRIFYYVILYEIIFSFKKTRATLICISLCFVNLTVNYYKVGQTDTATFLKYELYNFPELLLVAVVLFLVKYIIEINKTLSATQHRLQASNVELEAACDTLKEAYRKNEDYLIMQGKNKLAREIHDTVGHTLTTALVEMEASMILLDSDALKTNDLLGTNLHSASQKLENAIQQVRRGLNEVRHSVSALSSKNIDCYQEMIKLIVDMIKHTEVIIRYDIDDISAEKEALKKCIFRALQEGLTNSIRHGAATAIVFKLKYTESQLFFSLEDNGTGCSFYKKGFGLCAMEERVNETCGDIKIMTQPREGFSIYIKFHKINNVIRNKEKK